jgi:cysteine-rich repeat protein
VCCGDDVVGGDEQCDDGNTVGADGCAANCTNESTLALPLDAVAVVQTGLFALELQFATQQTFRLGGATAAGGARSCDGATEFGAGEMPVAARADELSFDPAQVPGLVCACVRAIALRRCGEPLVRPRGTDCSVGADCSADSGACTAPEECRPAHGEGNAVSGVIGCAGLENVDYAAEADNPTSATSCTRTGGLAVAGSAFIYSTTAIGTIMDSGTCAEDPSNSAKGPDGLPCTDDDPPTSRGVPNTVPLTTGDARARIFNVNGTPANIDEGVNCGQSPCRTSAMGRPFDCAGLPGNPRLCSAFSSLRQPTTGDIVVTACFEDLP